MDTLLETITAQWHAQRVRQAVAVHRPALPAASTPDEPGERKRRKPPVPAWWGSDEAATHESMAAMQALRGRS